MCTIYGVCKIHPGVNMTFNCIINKYGEVAKDNKSFQRVYFKVLIDPENDKEADIITFYNEVYIKVSKQYIMSLKPGYSADPQRSILSPMPGSTRMQINKPHVSALAPPSPLRESFPSYSYQFSTIYQTRANMTPGAGGFRSPLLGSNTCMTPATRHLYAFNESNTGDLDRANQFLRQ